MGIKSFKHPSFLILPLFLFFPPLAYAAEGCAAKNLGLTDTTLGFMAVGVFLLAYLFVIFEEFTLLRKSKPIVLASGLIWMIIAILAHQRELSDEVRQALNHNFVEYIELFLFLLVAMTYINALQERRVFEALRAWLVRKHFSYHQLFWITGLLAFFISPFADNLTTALIMCAVVMAVGSDKPKFISISCINIVVAANAGGAFSPFGDITTLMVWQKGLVPFHDFFKIFIPASLSFFIPAICMHFAVPKGAPVAVDEKIQMATGAGFIIILFLLTIITAITFHHFLELPPTLGMMMGLAYLLFYGYFLKQRQKYYIVNRQIHDYAPFNIFNKIERAEWDTLFFFYGVIFCVGGLATLGYLDLVSHVIYEDWGSSLGELYKHSPANIVVGFISAIVDNIPVMFAVLTMNPSMSEGQWLLVTLTTGIGGSLLSIGSAAGVALMGQSKGAYTFFGHLKWSWAILIGYFAAVFSHMWLNQHLF